MKHSIAVFAVLVCMFLCGLAQYTPDWTSLDKRPSPAWYDEAKFGIFIHWGVYSVPSWGKVGDYAEWYWYYLEQAGSPTQFFHNNTFGTSYRYQNFAEDFNAELWDPDVWASLIQASGARYVVLTSKHHEGFTLWPSAQSWNWNSVDIGPKRDLVADLSRAVKARGLHMGLYYSLYEWFHPLYRGPDPSQYVQQVMLPQMTDIINTYQPDVLWTDGEWEQSSAFWQSPQFLAWLYNESPVRNSIVIDDRWGNDTRGKHGGFYTVEYNYGTVPTDHKWESCRAIGYSFGLNRMENATNSYWNTTQLIHYLVQVVAAGGNLLLDIGPGSDGRIPVVMQERLLEIGKWLQVNGEAIYATQSYVVQNVSDVVYYTAASNGTRVYAIIVDWPSSNSITLPSLKVSPQTQVTMLGYPGTISWSPSGTGIAVKLPSFSPSAFAKPQPRLCVHVWDNSAKMPDGVLGSVLSGVSHQLRVLSGGMHQLRASAIIQLA